MNHTHPSQHDTNGKTRSCSLDDDAVTLEKLGYEQELLRRMSAFSNYAVSLSIICILAGCVTSFHVGYCSVGGASIGLGWPLVCLFSLTVAATMGQIASAYPTAGGLYHWATVLGGPRWGWITGCFNFAGLVTVLAAINVGFYQFLLGSLSHVTGEQWSECPIWYQHFAIVLITLSQAWLNYRGIRWTTLLTDFSGYWILGVAVILTAAMLSCSPQWHPEHLITFSNFSGEAGANVWPETSNISWLFVLGFLLPAYTITGFDASAHTAEETIGAAKHVPQGIVRSVCVSGFFGWIMLAAIVIAIPDPELVAQKGPHAFFWILKQTLPFPLFVVLLIAIAIAQYICGLATVTSASRMLYAFARDRGVPASGYLRRVGRYKTPGPAILFVSFLSVAFTLYTPVYSTITLACAIFLYISYVIPTWLGLWAYGKSWKRMGPWSLGRWYRPLAVLSIVGCTVLIAIGLAPPNDQAIYILVAFTAFLLTISQTRFGQIKLRECNTAKLN